MLGISATVDRKDNLTNVLYMFIGKKIYSEEREDEDPVVVQALQYKTNDDDFNEVLARGVYVYNLRVTNEQGLSADKTQTMFLLK